MRRGELLKLQWRHADITRGRFNLPAEMTKTGEGRTVVVSARLRAVLEMVRTNVLTGQPHAATAFVFGNAEGRANDPGPPTHRSSGLRTLRASPLSNRKRRNAALTSSCSASSLVPSTVA